MMANMIFNVRLHGKRVKYVGVGLTETGDLGISFCCPCSKVPPCWVSMIIFDGQDSKALREGLKAMDEHIAGN